ncbi:MAG: phosphodiesterase [Curvibacter sp. RIFCSPHIGHO2_12_FULL_63_18]|uniref:HD-GYP domain-containing protein n=1 Tax=Rhodoferax sp. TaxID=50421 RepID=UPI0008D8157A|nr:HD domain-containing phosphohydrolase [Rhodoferax sp.]OGO95727.1 MAG: phosphodiesterase [Curvibacter sp. GWA2_63_95]OGO99976.1 MAG: phosphodiesterase [Curvibacter sp. RIFCSPHIGHO2_12_FULL_63_18]HCX81943.1 phosphodiesterase [Rhodoferax sp.]
MSKPLDVRDENAYEDLLGQWSDLESGLGIILSSPASAQQFSHRVLQYDRWMQGLLQRDPDVGLYLLFQLASNSPVGYSASHALVCAVLCHLVATELHLPQKERNSLVHAALTMNIAMTALQDELADQAEKPTPAQQDAIRAHAIKGAMMLANLGVADDDWLDVVSSHHDDAVDKDDMRTAAPSVRLARILKVVDRYAAMISPRKSRSGRSAIESARSVMTRASSSVDAIGQALVRAVGLCPPGTYVRLDNDELGVVVRRSAKSNQPFVVVVGKPGGELENHPRLHSTAEAYPRIRSALPSSAVRAPLNHFYILQLGSHAQAMA